MNLFKSTCYHVHTLILLYMYMQVSKSGQVLQSEIVGSVKMRVRLTGMPELRLGLNDKVLFENTGSECDTTA